MKLKENDDQIVSLMTELNMKYDVLVSFASIPIHEFNKYKEVLTYYKNIEQEGAILNLRAKLLEAEKQRMSGMTTYTTDEVRDYIKGLHENRV